MLDQTLGTIKRFIPAPVFDFFARPYHWSLALFFATIYGFPSRKLKVLAVTGTKGKSSTTEILNAILEEAGFKTALSNTIRFKIAEHSRENLFKMSMPGRSFLQKFMRQAVQEKCTFFITEMTSQGAALYRHRFIELDTLAVTNISPEHIEAHGSYEKYVDAKLSICRNMVRSHKKMKSIIVNGDDSETKRFLECPANRKIIYSLQDLAPYTVGRQGLDFTVNGRKVHSPLSGLFNLYNIAAAVAIAKSEWIGDDVIARALAKFGEIPGRVEKIEVEPGQNGRHQDFEVVVDYAHTNDSLEKLYTVFGDKRKICVLGGTGGGRDNWKRVHMGQTADHYCDEIILTDEDPYDEDPRAIVADVAKGIQTQKPTIIMDRRAAIREAISRAKTGDVVLITGKGTDPYIMGPHGTKTPWSDAAVAREELTKKLNI